MRALRPGGATLLTVLILASAAGARDKGSVPVEFSVSDYPFDDGTALRIEWEQGLFDDAEVRIIRWGPRGERDTLPLVPAPRAAWIDRNLMTGQNYRYKLELLNAQGTLIATTTQAGAEPRPNWLNRARLGEGIVIVALFALFLWTTYRRRETFVRPIGGLAAMEDAIGRAVEMGKPILFSAGWGAQLDKPTTMAAMNIFGWLARKACSYDARLIFPAHDAVIMAAAQEAAHEAAQLEGRPEWYRAEDIYYVTGSQFGYAAALDGIMMRDRPAANLWLGTFAAESLILAETGNQVGAVQIAGTDSTIQLAFFLVTCDYTLIGEEVFAASAYLTRDPVVLGGLRAQDWLKIAVAAAVVVGLVGALFGWNMIGDWLRSI